MGVMSNNFREVQLSAEQIERLREISSHDQSLLGLLTSQAMTHDQAKFAIRLDRDSSEKLRDLLTEQLAKVGFDRDYKLSSEGRMLEELIDRLYEP
jgi:hypothetical protein